MRRSFALNTEVLGYAIALLLAAGLRLAKPTWPLLTDGQAAQALAAAAASGVPHALQQPEGISAAANGVYHAWTALFFQVGGLSDASARLLGALAGVALVLVPWSFRGVLGRWPSLFAAWLLALSPLLVVASRAPAGGMPALLAIGLGLAGYLTWSPSARANLLLGLCLGVAAAAGPEALTGLAGIGLGSLLYLAMRGRVVDALPRAPERNWGAIGLSAVVSFLLATSAVGLVPSGLPAGFNGVGSWLAGWATIPSLSGLTVLAAFVIYQPLWFALGVAGIFSASARRSAIGGWLTCWSLGSLAIAMIYPGRSIQALIWPTAAVSLLAGLPLADLLVELRNREGWASRLGLALAMLLVLCFAGLQIIGYTSGGLVVTSPVLGQGQQLFLAVAAILLVSLMIVLIGLGWSWREARVVTGAVGVSVLTFMAVAAIWRLNFSNWAGTGQELTTRTTSTFGQRLLADSLNTVAGARRASTDPVTLQVYGELPPSMAWSLRGVPVEWLPPSATEAPGIVLMPEEEYDLRSPSLRAEYRGQSLATQASWGWPGLLPSGLLDWYFRAVALVEQKRWVVLVRTDLVEPDLPPAASVQP